MNLEGKIAEVKEKTGYEPDRPVDNAYDLNFGERVRVIEDDEDNGVYSGDEGYVILETVGSAEYHNERTWLGLLIDGYDSPVDVEPDNIEST